LFKGRHFFKNTFPSVLKIVVVFSVAARKTELAQRARILRDFPRFIVFALGLLHAPLNRPRIAGRLIRIGPAYLRKSGPGGLPLSAGRGGRRRWL
jgi:hypothetical protein